MGARQASSRAAAARRWPLARLLVALRPLGTSRPLQCAPTRRFVGLLLVTKILPAGDEATIRRVFDAIGFTFLSRLLLPLLTPPVSARLRPSRTLAAFLARGPTLGA